MVCDEHLCYFLLRRDLLRNNWLQLPNDLTRVNLVLDSMEEGVLFQLEIFLLQDILPLFCTFVSLSFYL